MAKTRDNKALLEALSKEHEAKLIEEYENLNRDTTIKFKCSCGQEDEKVFRYIKENGGMRCKKCTLNERMKKINYETREIIKNKLDPGITILTKNFDSMTLNRSTILEYKCKCGKIHKKKIGAIKDTGFDFNGCSLRKMERDNYSKKLKEDVLCILENCRGELIEPHNSIVENSEIKIKCLICNLIDTKNVSYIKNSGFICKNNCNLEKTPKAKSENPLLQDRLTTDNATLLGESDNIDRNTIINFKCSCGEEGKKSFRASLKYGLKCKKCLNSELQDKINNARAIDRDFINNIELLEPVNIENKKYIRETKDDKGNSIFCVEIKNNQVRKIIGKDIYKNCSSIIEACTYRDKVSLHLSNVIEAEKNEKEKNIKPDKNKDGIVFLKLNNKDGLIEGKECLVDENVWSDIFNLNISLHLSNTGYPAFTKNRKTTLVHQYVMDKYGENKPVNKAVVIDHINRNKLDNRLENLKYKSPELNSQNREPNKTTGFKGVYKRGEKYRAIYSCNHIGVYSTAEESARAYDKFLIQIFPNEEPTLNYSYTDEEKEFIKNEEPIVKQSFPKYVSKIEDEYHIKDENEKVIFKCKDKNELIKKIKNIEKQTLESDLEKSLKEKDIERDKNKNAIIIVKTKDETYHSIVDDGDWHYLSLFNWNYKDGYAQRSTIEYGEKYNTQKVIRMHIELYEKNKEHIPDDKVIDHIDGNRLNNKMKNLRCVSYAENRKNDKRYREMNGEMN